MWTSLRIKNSEQERNLWGIPTFLWVLLPEAQPNSYSKDKRKILLCSWQGKGESSLFFLTRPDLKKNILFCQSLSDLGKGTPAPSSFPALPKEEGRLRCTIPKKKKGKMVVWGGLTKSWEKRVKGKGKQERYIDLNVEFQRIARRGKKAFLSD